MNKIILKSENIDFLTLSIGSFDYEIYNIIKDRKNLENLIIQINNIPKHARHRLHTFSRKNKVDIYSIGTEIDEKRHMVIELKKEYIEYLFKHCKLNQEIKPNENIYDQSNSKLEELLNTEFSKFKIELYNKIKNIY